MARAHYRLPLPRRPFMAYIHGIEVWENAPPHRIKWARRADLLVSNSWYTRQRADDCYGGFGHCPVCWLATETDALPATSPPFDGQPTVLIISRIDEPSYKGHHELLEAWPRVVSAVPEARLLIAGGGPGLASLKRAADRLPCRDRIELRGYVPEEEIGRLWAEADVFAMPSRGEGFGLVYIEAMRHGIPVVASIHDAAPEINLDGQTGFNVDLDRPGELADRLIELLRDRDAAAVLGRNGRERWRQHFRYSVFKSRFLPILNEFLR